MNNFVLEVTPITPAPAEPIDRALVRSTGRIDANANEDAWIDMAIKVARRQYEDLTNRSLVRTQYKLRCPAFHDCDEWGYDKPLRLPRGPALDLVSLGHRNPASSTGAYVQLAVDASAIAEIVTNRFAVSELRLKYGQTWPATVNAWDAVLVEWRAGTADGVPTAIDEELRLGMARLVCHFYENRDAGSGFIVPEDVMKELRMQCYRHLSP